MITGHSTVGTTAKQLDSVGYEAHQYIEIKADADNGDSVYVGINPGVTSGNGFRLEAGERLQIPLATTALVYVIGGASSMGYSYLVV